MSKKLAGKVAIVTGASKGIGASIAEHLAAEGASVVVNYATSKEGADSVVAKITQSGGKAFAIQGNMSNENDIKRLFAETLKKFGKLDILVNNAGIYEFAPIEKLTPEFFHKTFDLNVLGSLQAIREAVKCFGASGGNIINLGSISGKIAIAETSVYSASKAAIDAITRCLATELGPRKIRVNAVNPGLVETEGTHAQKLPESDFGIQAKAQTPLGRFGKPEDIAKVVVFLASDDSAWITGESHYVTGGLR